MPQGRSLRKSFRNWLHPIPEHLDASLSDFAVRTKVFLDQIDIVFDVPRQVFHGNLNQRRQGSGVLSIRHSSRLLRFANERPQALIFSSGEFRKSVSYCPAVLHCSG